MLSFIRRSSILLVSLVAGCVTPSFEGREDEGGATSAESAVTTTVLFPATSIAKGASKTGVYTATVAGTITFRTSGTGDADLYIKKGSAPTTTSYGAKSDGSTSTEAASLTVAVGDKVYWLVYGWSASTASLSVDTPDAPVPEVTVELFPSTPIALNASKTGEYTATIAGVHTFRTRGTGDVDVYLRKAGPASPSSYDAMGEGSTATEDVKITLPAGQKVHWTVFGYKASTANLVVALPPAPSYATTLSLATLSDPSAFTAFSTSGGGLSSSGRSMKFLIDNRTPTARTTNFVNGNYKVSGVTPDYAKYHYYFAQKRYGITDSVATFNNSTYFSSPKRFYAGNIQTYKLGEATEPVYAIQFYPDDIIAEADLLEGLKTVKAAFTVPGAKLIFVATGPQQTFATIGAQAAALGIELKTIDQILGDIKYVALNTGEAWGYLRIFPTNVNALSPKDIPVFDELPLDLSVVAGTITKAYQDINSHVNLKAKERNTPNMVLRDASPTNPLLAPYEGKPVHLVVRNDGFTIEPTTDAIIQEKLDAKLAGPWVPLPVVDATALVSFDEECPVAASTCFNFATAYGGKTQGLGFLVGALGRAATSTSASAPFGYDLTPRGFGIPVKAYRDFIAAPENTAIKAAVDELIALEKGGGLSPLDRDAKVTALQNLFYKGKVPGTLVADVTARLGAIMPGVDKFKFRSSATSEDVPNFNGAGLYDSFSIEPVKVDNPDLSCLIELDTTSVVTKLKVKPKTVQCGIKAVFASLWNSRALVERTFGRLDHVTASMGVTINPSYGDELANLVLVTRVVGTDAVYGYTLSVQKGENLVTNPIPADDHRVRRRLVLRRHPPAANLDNALREADSRRSGDDHEHPHQRADAADRRDREKGRDRLLQDQADLLPGRQLQHCLPRHQQAVVARHGDQDPPRRAHPVQAGPRVPRPLNLEIVRAAAGFAQYLTMGPSLVANGQPWLSSRWIAQSNAPRMVGFAASSSFHVGTASPIDM